MERVRQPPNSIFYPRRLLGVLACETASRVPELRLHYWMESANYLHVPCNPARIEIKGCTRHSAKDEWLGVAFLNPVLTVCLNVKSSEERVV